MTYIELLLFISLLPTILLGTYIYKHDKLEKEPKKLLIKLFIGGILSIVITLLITLFISIFFPIILDNEYKNIFELFISCFIFVGLVEEGSKWFILKIMTWDDNNFDHLYDAIVYSSFVSLGFATVENILYVFNNGFVTGILRALLSVPGHLFFGIFMGYFYSLAKYAWHNKNIKLYRKNLILSIIVPTLLHGFFDFCLFSGSVILMIVFLIFIIIMYIKSFGLVNRLSKEDQKIINKKYCSYCGNLVNSNYCSYCGNKINVSLTK